MRKMEFTKAVAAGNDFVVIDNKPKASSHRLAALARKMCDRKYGIGADGLLVLEKSKIACVRMRIFNPDGSEAEMCGNGVRCFSLYVYAKRKARNAGLKIETKAGIVEARIHGQIVKARLTNPSGMKLDIPIQINNRSIRVNYINTGVPHTVIFVQGLYNIDVKGLGRQIRFHPRFAPAGTNVNFVEVLSSRSVKIRTYERGVEDETLACGTGSTAAALITSMKLPVELNCIQVYTQGKEVLKVYFQKTRAGFQDVWLEGRVRIVYEGVYYV